MFVLRAIFQFESDAFETAVEVHWLLTRKAVAVEAHLEACRAQDHVEAVAQAISRNHLERVPFLCQFAAIGVQAKDGIVSDHSRRGPKRPAEAQVNFAVVPPRSPAHLFVAKPGASPGTWFKAAAGATIVLFAEKPVAVIRLRSARV